MKNDNDVHALAGLATAWYQWTASTWPACLEKN